MINAKKKAPVVQIDGGGWAPSVVSQERLKELRSLQNILWIASQGCQSVAFAIETETAHGATVERGRLRFDPPLKMVIG